MRREGHDLAAYHLAVMLCFVLASFQKRSAMKKCCQKAATMRVDLIPCFYGSSGVTPALWRSRLRLREVAAAAISQWPEVIFTIFYSLRT